jgi:CopG family nickel-responsive transcriptional regulator
VSLDHQNRLESVMLKGLAAVPVFADRVQVERGVRHGQLNLVAVHTGDVHADMGTHRHDGHLHLMPRS